ncbi:MAG: energy transducer TonB [Acetobacteraceae bacterium]
MQRRLLIAAVVSLALHLVPGLVLLLRPIRLPPERPQEPGRVELVMVEQKGAGERQDQQPQTQPEPQDQAQETRAEPQQAQQQRPDLDAPEDPAIAQPVPPPAVQDAPEEIVPPPPPPPPPAEPASPRVMAARPVPAPPQQPAVPEFNLGGTDSLSNAIALGTNIIPARPDDMMRNRPPVYPLEAARRGEQGTVVLNIHVSPQGTTLVADVVQSSGYPRLDRAAVDAVTGWHFLPAVRDGRPVPFELLMGFNFTFD